MAMGASSYPLTSNAICAPSGDQAGAEPYIPEPTWLTPLPSAFMTAIFSSPYCPYRVVANAILAPSGDQVGPESQAGSVVSRTKPVPSELIAQMSELPLSTTQLKARRPPSGDHAGCPAPDPR